MPAPMSVKGVMTILVMVTYTCIFAIFFIVWRNRHTSWSRVVQNQSIVLYLKSKDVFWCIKHGSRSLSKCEQAYAQIETEMLASVSACKTFYHFIYGRYNVTIETNHLSLIIFFYKPLHCIPLRLQNIKMHLQHYSVNIVRKMGTVIPVADALIVDSIVEKYLMQKSLKWMLWKLKVFPISLRQ